MLFYFKLSKKLKKFNLNVCPVDEGLNNSPQCSSRQKCTKRDTEKRQRLRTCPTGCPTRNEINAFKVQKKSKWKRNPLLD